MIEEFFPRNGVRYIAMNDGIEVFIDRNKADVADAEILLNVIAGVNGVSAQTGEVF